MKKKIGRYAVLIIILCVIFEGLSFLTVLYLRERGIFYHPTAAMDYENYLKTRHPVLGWPAPNSPGEKDRDAAGSRIIPAYPDTADKTCISLYGDSFTWSSEVDNAHAWSNVLSEFIQCRVANYGVGGYGTDQSFLRFKHNPHDDAEIVILCHLSENIIRNVNQFRDLLYPGDGVGFKPRFILHEEDSLDFIPIPDFTRNEYKNLLKDPAAYLNHEYFLPGSSDGMDYFCFPFTLSIIRTFSHYRIQAKLRGEPWYAEFYDATHPSRALRITTLILKKFVNQTHKKGRTPLVVIIPTGQDLLYYTKHQTWIYQKLIDALSKEEITPLNVGEGIIDYLNNNDPCILFDDCSAHYNERGYRVIALTVYEYLKHNALIK